MLAVVAWEKLLRMMGFLYLDASHHHRAFKSHVSRAVLLLSNPVALQSRVPRTRMRSGCYASKGCHLAASGHALELMFGILSYVSRKGIEANET